MQMTKRRKSLRQRISAFVAAAALLVGACSTAPMNEPLNRAALNSGSGSISIGGYRSRGLPEGETSDQLLVLLASSGGGSRSAAFSYGVLRGLRDYKIDVNGRERRLLDEVDTYAAVSGGSFPAAYYGLYRDRLFTDFERDFLKADIDDYIWGIYLLPWKWEWMVNPIYGTNDEMGAIYDRLMFHGATYADLLRNGKPFVSINATDINYGTVFAFSQDEFDLICSDLSSFPIARAVAASNGFPVLFSPITLTSYAKQCGGREPVWVKAAAAGGSLSRERQLAELARLYLDPEKTSYVHLMDGGIADNLAMRFMIETAIAYGDNVDRIREAGFNHARRILLISADGESSRDSSWPQQRTVSGLGQIFSAVSGTQIDSYNFETLILANSELRRLVAFLKKVRCAEAPIIDGHPCDDVQGFFEHLSLSAITDASEREKLQHIPTGLTIPDTDVDELVAAGEKQVRESKVLSGFRDSLSGRSETVIGE
jgi:NTE family protein